MLADAYYAPQYSSTAFLTNMQTSSSVLVDPVSGDISDWLQQILRPTMIANKRHFNLYLHTSTLRSPPRPLLNAMNLVACHILSLSATSDTRPTLQELEELKKLLLSKVHSGIHTSLEGARDLIAGSVCAPALASQYLLQVGRFAEAHWLASNAIRFAVSCGLHMIDRRWFPGAEGSPGSTSSGFGGSFLVPASSAREHHDRQMSWWLAFAADGLVQMVAGLDSAVRPELRACIGDVDCGIGQGREITTAFPLAESTYEGDNHANVYGTTITHLLSSGWGEGNGDQEYGCMFGMRMRSLAFFQIAALVSDDLDTSRSLDASLPYNVDQRISAFIAGLPNLTYQDPSDTANGIDGQVNPDMVVVHMLAYTARLRLLASDALVNNGEQRFETSMAVGRLAAGLQGETHYGWSQIVKKCCSEALQVLSAESETRGIRPVEIESLHSLLGKLYLDTHA